VIVRYGSRSDLNGWTCGGPGENALYGTIRDIIYLGETMHVIVTVPRVGDVTVAVRNEGQLIKPLAWKRGDLAAVAWLPEDCQILEQE
jgi:TOBE domain